MMFLYFRPPIYIIEPNKKGGAYDGHLQLFTAWMKKLGVEFQQSRRVQSTNRSNVVFTKPVNLAD